MAGPLIRYRILDPTGNLTAVVGSAVEPVAQPACAAALMRRHPEVEQVGFLRLPSEQDALPALRMAGGEFCGNASMCAAVCCALAEGEAAAEETRELLLRVSGADAPVALRLRQTEPSRFETAVRMPEALDITDRPFSLDGLRGKLPTVRMQGITHLIVRPDSVFYPLLGQKPTAERAARTFCAELGAEGLGLLFLEGEAPACRMTPLVYIPGSGTCFWESSCASGSAAAGMFLSRAGGAPLRATLVQPGGSLRVDCGAGETWLYGSVRPLGEYEAVPE